MAIPAIMGMWYATEGNEQVYFLKIAREVFAGG